MHEYLVVAICLGSAILGYEGKADGEEDDRCDQTACSQGELGEVPPLAPRPRLLTPLVELLCNRGRRLKGHILDGLGIRSLLE